MIEQLARHARFDLPVRAISDTLIDGHHTTEVLAITPRERSVANALGDKRDIRRYGEAALPMDETLLQAAIDRSGRTYFRRSSALEMIGSLGVDSLAQLEALAREGVLEACIVGRAFYRRAFFLAEAITAARSTHAREPLHRPAFWPRDAFVS